MARELIHFIQSSLFSYFLRDYEHTGKVWLDNYEHTGKVWLTIIPASIMQQKSWISSGTPFLLSCSFQLWFLHRWPTRLDYLCYDQCLIPNLLQFHLLFILFMFYYVQTVMFFLSTWFSRFQGRVTVNFLLFCGQGSQVHAGSIPLVFVILVTVFLFVDQFVRFY